jgi:hypothetical protein
MTKTLAQYPIAELKKIYALLHRELTQMPELMDAELLHDLQLLLQASAKADGVDVTHHAQWATWLNGGVKLKQV